MGCDGVNTRYAKLIILSLKAKTVKIVQSSLGVPTVSLGDAIEIKSFTDSLDCIVLFPLSTCKMKRNCLILIRKA